MVGMLATNLYGGGFANSVGRTLDKLTLGEWIAFGLLASLLSMIASAYGFKHYLKRYYVTVRPNMALYWTDNSTTEVLFAGGKLVSPWGETTQVVPLYYYSPNFVAYAILNGISQALYCHYKVEIGRTALAVEAAVRKLGTDANSERGIARLTDSIFRDALSEHLDSLPYGDVQQRMLDPQKRSQFATLVEQQVAAKVMNFGLIVSDFTIRIDGSSFRS